MSSASAAHSIGPRKRQSMNLAHAVDNIPRDLAGRVVRGMTWGRLTTAGAMGQWRSRWQEVDGEFRPLGVVVPEAV